MKDEWNEWLYQVLSRRPKNNRYLDSERGFEIGKLCLDIERELFSWRRGDIDTFWVDVQLFTKYKLSDTEIKFALRYQMGLDNYKKNSDEKNAYSEMIRGLEKLKKINGVDEETVEDAWR